MRSIGVNQKKIKKHFWDVVKVAIMQKQNWLNVAKF